MIGAGSSLTLDVGGSYFDIECGGGDQRYRRAVITRNRQEQGRGRGENVIDALESHPDLSFEESDIPSGSC